MAPAPAPAPAALLWETQRLTFQLGDNDRSFTPTWNGEPIVGCSLAASSAALPQGLSLDTKTCSLTGTPAAPLAPFVLVLKIDLPSGAVQSSVEVMIADRPATLDYGTAVYQLVAGRPIAVAATTGGGAITSCKVAENSAALPAGLTLAADCGFSGTPTVGAVGEHEVTVSAAFVGGATTAPLKFRVYPPVVVATSVMTVKNGRTLTVSATGGLGPYTFSVASGLGTMAAIDSDEATYTAKGGGPTVLEATDALGAKGTRTVHVQGFGMVDSFLPYQDGNVLIYDAVSGPDGALWAAAAVEAQLPGSSLPATRARIMKRDNGVWSTVASLPAPYDTARAHAIVLDDAGRVFVAGLGNSSRTFFLKYESGAWTALKDIESSGFVNSWDARTKLAKDAAGNIYISYTNPSSSPFKAELGMWDGATFSVVDSYSLESDKNAWAGGVTVSGGTVFHATSSFDATFKLHWIVRACTASVCTTSDDYLLPGSASAWIYNLRTMPNGDVVAMGGGGQSGIPNGTHAYVRRLTGASWTTIANLHTGGTDRSWALDFAEFGGSMYAVVTSMTTSLSQKGRVFRFDGVSWVQEFARDYPSPVAKVLVNWLLAHGGVLHTGGEWADNAHTWALATRSAGGVWSDAPAPRQLVTYPRGNATDRGAWLAEGAGGDLYIQYARSQTSKLELRRYPGGNLAAPQTIVETFPNRPWNYYVASNGSGPIAIAGQAITGGTTAISRFNGATFSHTTAVDGATGSLRDLAMTSDGTVYLMRGGWNVHTWNGTSTTLSESFSGGGAAGDQYGARFAVDGDDNVYAAGRIRDGGGIYSLAVRKLASSSWSTFDTYAGMSAVIHMAASGSTWSAQFESTVAGTFFSRAWDGSTLTTSADYVTGLQNVIPHFTIEAGGDRYVGGYAYTSGVNNFAYLSRLEADGTFSMIDVSPHISGASVAYDHAIRTTDGTTYMTVRRLDNTTGHYGIELWKYFP